MYKIYINGTPLFLTSVEEAQQFGPASERILILRYAGKKKFLLNVADQLEKTSRFERVVVFHDDPKILWTAFKGIYKKIEAAGAAVFNEKNKVLMIFRRGHWDLPKGKIDKGETPKEAALREVEEETGLTELVLGKPLTDTWHTYRLKGRRILKKTYWFKMKTTQNELTPQTEEDIEEAVWTNLHAFLEQPGKVYGSILDVLKKVAE